MKKYIPWLIATILVLASIHYVKPHFPNGIDNSNVKPIRL